MIRRHRDSEWTDTPLRKHAGGFAVEGAGYFIWDEDPQEVLRAARELERGNFKLNPSTRFMVLRDDFDLSA